MTILNAVDLPFIPSADAEALFQSKLDAIADTLALCGYLILDDLLPCSLYQSLLATLEGDLERELRPAGIGRGDDFQQNQEVRRDKIHWLEEDSHCPAVIEFLYWMDKLREGLNCRLFLGLFEYECHFAVYEPGDFYHTHFDAFKDVTGTGGSRKLSSVFYLNPAWVNEDGGELVLYDEAQQQRLEVIAPIGGRLVLFLSEDFPHEVLVANRKRYSIAGWFRVNPLLS